LIAPLPSGKFFYSLFSKEFMPLEIGSVQQNREIIDYVVGIFLIAVIIGVVLAAMDLLKTILHLGY
jgi:hypothetical protein